MCCRWPGTHLPVVKFVNGREEVLLPEVFTAEVAAVGVCKRLQVSLLTLQSGFCSCLKFLLMGRQEIAKQWVGRGTGRVPHV